MSLRLISIRLYLAVDRVWRRLSRVLSFWRKSRGAEAFLKRYHPENILAVSEVERSRAVHFEKCMVCSLCTFSCQAIAEGKAPSAFEPKQIVVRFARNLQDSEIFLEEWFPCRECNACTVLCPNEVPVHEIVDQVIQRRQRVGFRRP